MTGLAANLTASATLNTNYVAGQAVLSLAYNVTAADTNILQSSFTIQISSAQGVVIDLPITFTVIQPMAIWWPSPPTHHLDAGRRTDGRAIRGDEHRRGASGPMSVIVPQEPWLAVASMNPLASLAPGQSNLVTLLLTAPGDLALGPYTGNLAVNSINAGVQIPFTFNAVSDAHGSTAHSSRG